MDNTYLSEQRLKIAQYLLDKAERIVVFSGAGLSKASGIPTYRDFDGLWASEEALQYSTVEDWERDPAGFTKYWSGKLEAFNNARPNHGHLALAKLQRQRPETTLITQNVDGLLGDAGARDVLELHGSLRRWRCGACGSRGSFLYFRCPKCGGQARPDVVMFGEALDVETLSSAERASRECDLFLVVGSTAMVYPAAHLPLMALQNGAKLVTLNTEPLPHDDAAHVVLRGQSEELLPKLVAGLRCE